MAKAASPLRIAFSYVFDYVVVFVLAGIWSYIATLEPNYSRFSLTDKTLQYPIADPETVPFGSCLVYSVLLPIAVIAVWSFVVDRLRYSHNELLWEFNVGFLGIALSESFTFVITTSLKGIVGRPRPDSIARCLPYSGAADAEVWGLSEVLKVCTQTDPAILAEGWRSWPSGHSSTAFAGLGYLSFFLAGKLSLYDTRGEAWKAAIVMFPLLGAGAIATSRIKDHRHHGTDVLSGSIIGLAVAWAAYRLYYPSLADTARQGRAWPIRMYGSSKLSPPVPFADELVDDEETALGSAGAVPGAADFRRRGLQSDGTILGQFETVGAAGGGVSAGSAGGVNESAYQALTETSNSRRY
ncbi:phosphatidic acid phosphatase type 2/haloperoxidase [Lipomyces oligophaga]|uniref:phosphatidic acid phosphatase type 2/haloperoxidase n=1 Tax=Lipomyces oligophaga TaxID=45792 RepID=UPI0034CD1138